MNPVLQINHVTWKRNGKTILRDLQWHVNPGEHWVILGSNGSGKSSLLQLITGHHWPTSGTVQVLQQELGRCDVQALRQSIGMISSAVKEQWLAFHPSEDVLSVVASGLRATIGYYGDISDSERTEVLKNLEVVQALHLRDEPFHTLSQGEKQRVLIARAWMTNPSLYILDEPCHGLDVRSRESFLQALYHSIQTNTSTTLYVTHHIEEILPIFTHVLFIKDGEILAHGPLHDTLTSENASETFGVPMEIHWEHGRPWASLFTSWITSV